jgi:hypothetical protein
MFSFLKRLDDYETMDEVFRNFKLEMLEITLLEKLYQIIQIRYIELFPNKLAENKINIKNWIQIQFEFLNYSSEKPS